MDSDRWDRKRQRWERKMHRWERRFERRRYMRSPAGHLFTGAVFVTIGALFLLANMGLLDVEPVLRFWPVILIALGVFRILEHREDYRQSAGIFWIVVGSLFLLGSVGVLRVTIRDFWPVILIGFGALMLWKSALSKRERTSYSENNPFRRNPFKGNPFRYRPMAGVAEPTTAEQPRPNTETSSNSFIGATAILGSVERRNNSQDFRGGHATAIMGGCEIDLAAASIVSPNEAVIEVFAVWGGIEIRVPPDWTVVSNVDPIMGGYEDATHPPKEESKRCIIRGTVIMGGVEVTN